MRKLEVAKQSVKNMPFDALALHVISHEVSSHSGFFLDDRIFYGDHFTFEGHQKGTF